MSKMIYMAPMEGVTDSIFRNTFAKYYGGIDKYFTPFLSPNDTKKFTTREWKDIDPETNDINTTIPQILTNKSEHFIWCVNQLVDLGYKEVNFNLGCPSGTVVAKHKGSGLLYYTEELDRLLNEVFAACDIDISIKTRLGKNEPEEFYEILDIYNKYPIKELTLHPRIQTDYYRQPVRPQFFQYAYEASKSPLIYNGDLNTTADIDNCLKKFPNINGVMLGRGLIANPGLALGLEFDLETFKKLHNDLLYQYQEVLSGDKPLLHRMKEFWSFWGNNFPDNEKELKKIRKANRLEEYKSSVSLLVR